MRIAVVGNRTGWTQETISKHLMKRGIRKTDVIVSGGAEGVDSFAQQFAKYFGCSIHVFYPDQTEPSPKRYFDRNEQIAGNCDTMIAFNKEGRRSGTGHVISKTKKLGIPVMVITEDG